MTQTHDQFQRNDEDPVASVYDIPEDAKVILKDNRRGRLLDRPEKGFMVHIVFDDGYHLITDPSDIEAFIGNDGWTWVVD